MKRVLTGHDDIFGPWVLAQSGGGTWYPQRGVTVGLWKDDVGPVAGLIFENCNGASIVVHMAGVGTHWLNREFLWFGFYYPFIQLKVKKMVGPVFSDNLKIQKLVTHLGFTLEATLKDAAPKGDLLIYTLTREECRFLDKKDSYSERRRKRRYSRPT